jgi:hypothetical protein
MSETSDRDGGGTGGTVSLDMDIRNGRTEIRVSGDRDTAIIVRSASGEKIYLPPEDFERKPESRPSAYDSPYQASRGSGDSPYQASRSVSSVTGMEPTADGYVIVHPEPVTDVRFIR